MAKPMINPAVSPDEARELNISLDSLVRMRLQEQALEFSKQSEEEFTAYLREQAEKNRHSTLWIFNNSHITLSHRNHYVVVNVDKSFDPSLALLDPFADLLIDSRIVARTGTTPMLRFPAAPKPSAPIPASPAYRAPIAAPAPTASTFNPAPAAAPASSFEEEIRIAAYHDYLYRQQLLAQQEMQNRYVFDHSRHFIVALTPRVSIDLTSLSVLVLLAQSHHHFNPLAHALRRLTDELTVGFANFAQQQGGSYFHVAHQALAYSQRVMQQAPDMSDILEDHYQLMQQRQAALASRSGR